MDIIENCLSLAPVPYLVPAFKGFKFIWTTVQQVQASKKQLEILAQAISQLLETLDTEYRSGKLAPATTFQSLDRLNKYVDFALCHVFVQ